MRTRWLPLILVLGAIACGRADDGSDLEALDVGDESLSSARCSVVPNSVTLGATYSVQISGVAAGKSLTVVSREADGTARSSTLTADASGAAQTSFVSVAVGSGQVGVSTWRRHRDRVIARCSFTVVSDTPTPPPPPPPTASCGDNACLGDETCASCTADCGACVPQCGDRTCDAGETCSSCSTDCGACTTYTKMVGPGQQFTTLAAAIAASRDGDHIGVMAGTYTNDFSTINTKVTISGVGGLAHFTATVSPPNGKAILVTRNDVVVERLEFSNVHVPDLNGAGIRIEVGNLDVRNCYFHDNEDGILGGQLGQNVTITRSEFARNGAGDGYSHGVYINTVTSVTVTDSYFHDTKVGHHLKSRALSTTIENNRFDDGTNGTASYNIDLPNGGVAIVRNNVLVQSTTSQNPGMIHYGGEVTPPAGSSCLIEGNVLQNFRSSATGVVNQTSVTATIRNNQLYNLPTLVSGPNTSSGNTTLSQPVTVDTTSPW